MYGLLTVWEQAWRIGESARLPPVWPGFDSNPVPFGLSLLLVLSLLGGFVSGFSGFPPSAETNISKFQFDQDNGLA